MKTPLVSVVIPVRNYERYIGPAIESVQAQTFKDWELIIVDDCSSDGTPEIISRYADGQNIRVLRNETNLGQFPTHNRGAELARGKYLKFFHGDDLMYPHCLEMMVTLMEAFPEAGLGISHPAWPWTAPHLFSPVEAWRAELGGQTGMLCQGPSASIFRLDVFQRAGGYSSRFSGGDAEMNFRTAMENPILLLPFGLWWWRLHSQQVSNWRLSEIARIKRAVEDFIWMQELLADPRNPLPTEEKQMARRRSRRNFVRLALFHTRRGRIRSAVQLLRGAKLPLRSLGAAFDRLGPRATVPVDQTPKWNVFPRLTHLAHEEKSAARQTPTVSVLIPAHNAEATISSAIESVLRQEFTGWELIIVDDASSDRTGEICRRYADNRRIFYHRNEKKLGKWANHNRCAEYARSEYIKFLHADDMLYPHCLQVMVSLAETHPEAALIQSHRISHYVLPKVQSPAEIYQQEYFGSDHLRESPTGTLFRRSAWRTSAGFDPRCPTADAKLNLELCRKSSAVLAYSGLAFFRRASKQWRHQKGRDREYQPADANWRHELLLHPDCPLEEADRLRALKNVRAMRRHMIIRPLLAQPTRIGRFLAQHLTLPHSYGDDYWGKYGETVLPNLHVS